MLLLLKGIAVVALVATSEAVARRCISGVCADIAVLMVIAMECHAKACAAKARAQILIGCGSICGSLAAGEAASEPQALNDYSESLKDLAQRIVAFSPLQLWT